MLKDMNFESKNDFQKPIPENPKKLGKTVRAITAGLALLGAVPAFAQSEHASSQGQMTSRENISKTELRNKEIEMNVENFGVEGLAVGPVSRAGRDRGIHYQRGLYLNGNHLGDIVYPAGRVVDEIFFLDRVYEILKAHGLAKF